MSTRAAYRGDESVHLGFKRSEFIAKFVTCRQKVSRSAAGFRDVLADVVTFSTTTCVPEAARETLAEISRVAILCCSIAPAIPVAISRD